MEIYNESFTLSSKDLVAFSRQPRRVVLYPGDQLYRYVSIVSAHFKGNEIFASPWWIPSSTYHQIAKTALRTQQSMSDVARSRLAVAAPWNPSMDWLMVIELKKAVQGWVGPARPQPLDGQNRSVLLLGNFDQAYVPGLAPADSTASAAAMLMYFGPPS